MEINNRRSGGGQRPDRPHLRRLRPDVAEFTPTAQRGATIAIFGALYTLAGIIAPAANGSVIENAPTLLDGYQTGYRICAVIQMAGGLLGLLLMRPAADRTRVARHRAAMAAQHR